MGELRRVTVTLRVKEEEQDYRYFPEPDLVPIAIEKELIEKTKSTMPELPDAHKDRLMKKYSISSQNAEVLVNNKILSDFFEECLESYSKPDIISNWLVGDLLGYIHEKSIKLSELKIGPKHIVSMLELIDDGTISGKIAKEVLEEMIDTGKEPEIIIKEKGLIRIHSRATIEKLADEVFRKHSEAVKDALKEEKAMHFLIGKIMEMTKGKADPELTKEIVKDKIAEQQKS